MPDVEINNLSVDFPYEPYDIQKDYMSKIIECLQKKTNGVLESPTGTGKTLSLLCSSLAWHGVQKAMYQMKVLNCKTDLNEFTSNLESKLFQQSGGATSSSNWNSACSKIVYASRTHSQLNQVILELKKTAYKHVKVGILGSRDQLCIHPKVSLENNVGSKVHMCRTLVSSRACHFYNNVEHKIKEPLFKEDVLVDIEDLVKKGKQMQCCPYYVSRELQHEADILFTPYNYLLDPKTRRAQDIRLLNDVVILDEAHNVEKVCEESSSSQISSTIIALCNNEVTSIMKLFHSEVEQNSIGEINLPKDFTEQDLIWLKTIFLEIEKKIDNIPLTPSGDKKSATFAGSYIFNILEAAEITPNNVTVLLEKLNQVGQFLITTNESQLHQQGIGFSKFIEFLEIVSLSLGQLRSTKNTDLNYKLYIELEVPKISKGNSSWSTTAVPENTGKVLNFWCFNPGFSMRSLYDQGVHSIILTSGTLSPLAATISEIGITVDVQLSNPHIIKPNQICAVVIDKGPANTELRCTYQNRTNPKYLMDLGQTCLNLYRVTPGGVLVFFPSYPFLKSCMECWQENGIWDKMAALKSIFVEPQNKDALKPLMDEYYKTIEDKLGASLFAVCRGKISEGLDFSDSRARAVIVVGLPYPPFHDPKVVLKRAYMDNGKKENLSKLDGNEWYQLEAMRAVNQAVGRVIRHAADHGAIIFCDCRFSYSNNVKSLSTWLQKHIVTNLSFGQAFKIISGFFKNWKESLPEITSRQNVNILPDSSLTVYRPIKPAQKLAPNSISSQSADFTKQYASCSSIKKKETHLATNVRKRSILESLHEEFDDMNANTENKSSPDRSFEGKEKHKPTITNIQFQEGKRRKLNVIPIRFDNEVPAPEQKFDTIKYISKLQKKLTAEQVKTFKNAARDYVSTQDCKTFISKSSELFLSTNDTQMVPFFRDIVYFLITEEHKRIFWESYNKHITRINKSIK